MGLIFRTYAGAPVFRFRLGFRKGTAISGIEWKQADALALPFENQSFDVVACQFGVMFFPDKVQGYREAWRVLKPGGRFLFNVWDRISENEFADTITEALAAVFPHRTHHTRHIDFV